MNPFQDLDLKAEIEEFREKIGGFSSRYTYDLRRFSKYLYSLSDPIAFSQTFTMLTDSMKAHVMRVLANFTRYLDLKYDTSVYSDYYTFLRKRLKFKWTLDHKPTWVPSVEELKDIIRIASYDRRYALYLYMLAVTGLRPGELQSITLNSNIIEITKQTRTKRAYYAFIPPHALQLARELGMLKVKPPRREAYKLKEKIWKRYPEFREYSLRHFYATYMAMKGMEEVKIDFLQGRAGRSVLRRHYIHLAHREILEQLYNEYKEKIQDLDQTLYNIIKTGYENTILEHHVET